MLALYVDVTVCFLITKLLFLVQIVVDLACTVRGSFRGMFPSFPIRPTP